MDDKHEKLGQLIDRLDNFAHALLLPMPPAFHVDQFKKSIPDLVVEFKKAFTELTGENPWE